MKKDNKKRLFEIMSVVDKSFKNDLNEGIYNTKLLNKEKKEQKIINNKINLAKKYKSFDELKNQNPELLDFLTQKNLLSNGIFNQSSDKIKANAHQLIYQIDSMGNVKTEKDLPYYLRRKVDSLYRYSKALQQRLPDRAIKYGWGTEGSGSEVD